MEIRKALESFGLEKWETLSSNSLRSLYKDLAKRTHPDKNGGKQDKFIELQKAFDLLSKKITVLEKKEKEQNKEAEKAAAAENSTEDKKEVDEEEEKAKAKMEGVVMSDSRDLKSLDKEEILDKYLNVEKRLTVVEESFKQNMDAIVEAKQIVSMAVAEFDNEKAKFREELEKSVERLEKDYNAKGWKKLFRSKMSQEEFAEKYDECVKKYSGVSTKLDSDFFKHLISIYGEALNKIQENIKENE